ncbi:tetrapyrrole biosynthesis, uroporphyrinogen III synthase [Daedaleopsis nitida]|nr:tetrapyrrole biosynthesis, uroporphyrinogen III synthase [Daedaleopsis nitida]
MPGDVLLLRSPSEDSPGPDKYDAAFRARGYRALSIPVLETVYVHASELVAAVRARGQIPAQTQPVQAHSDPDSNSTEEGRTGGPQTYAGVIVTSGRACEAWRTAVQQLEHEQGRADADSNSSSASSWSAIPFYAVGPSTASALITIEHSFPSSLYVPYDVRGGDEAGTSEKLAHFIVSDLAGTPVEGEGEGHGRKKLLYLTGDKNRDTLPAILTQASLELDSLQVYATQGSTRFEEDLANALNGVQALDPNGDEHWWIVYFAPSSAKHVLPILRKQFEFAGSEEVGETTVGRRARVAAIGTTTSKFLESELKVKVDVVPPKPSPDALVEEITGWDREHAP